MIKTQLNLHKEKQNKKQSMSNIFVYSAKLWEGQWEMDLCTAPRNPNEVTIPSFLRCILPLFLHVDFSQTVAECCLMGWSMNTTEKCF